MKYEFRYIVTVIKSGRKSFNNNNSFNNFGSPWIMGIVIFTFFFVLFICRDLFSAYPHSTFFCY